MDPKTQAVLSAVYPRFQRSQLCSFESFFILRRRPVLAKIGESVKKLHAYAYETMLFKSFRIELRGEEICRPQLRRFLR